MKKYLVLLFALGNLTLFASANPFICFTDITSGPATGNTDISQPGQVSGQEGAIVTLWGKNLGMLQGTSQVLVGGIAARIYGWRNATTPAELYSTLGLQMIEFQIPAAVPSGLTEIKVIVQGIESNVLPFTIRPGNIYYLKTSGNDATGDGSWANPWATLDNTLGTGALDKINAGDIIYVGDGVSHTELAGDRATIDLGNPATAAAPKAIIGYPGANASIGNNMIEKCYSLWVSGFGPTINFTIAKLNLTGQFNVASMYHGFRVVGNRITAPNGTGPTGAVAGKGNHLYLLGNELTNIGFLGTTKLYHPIYIESEEACSGPRRPTEFDREIAWNNLHDNLSYDGINIYRECPSSAYMTNHRIHNNIILNQTGCGIRIGDYVVGENWIYNNVVINAGLGPNPPAAEAMHVPVHIHAGWDDTTTLIHFYNNTIYGGGFTGGAAWSSSMVGFSFNHPFDLDFRNNIIVSTIPGIGYLNSRLSVPTGGVQNNIWFGAGSAPAWDANPLNVNPMFRDIILNDLRPQLGSPAINAAVPITGTSLQPLPLRDFDAVIRPQNNISDIGAYEFFLGAPLPVNWLSVRANIINSTRARIIWKVNNEQNVKGYIVQSSTDGLSFSDLCNVNANNSVDYSCEVQFYSGKINYFRVKQYDLD